MKTIQEHISHLLPILEAMKKRPGMYLGIHPKCETSNQEAITRLEIWIFGYDYASDFDMMKPFIGKSKLNWKTKKTGPCGLRSYDTLDEAIDNVAIYLTLNKDNEELL